MSLPAETHSTISCSLVENLRIILSPALPCPSNTSLKLEMGSKLHMLDLWQYGRSMSSLGVSAKHQRPV